MKKPTFRPFEEFEREMFLKRPGVKKAYDDLELEFSIIEAVLEKRLQRKMTQAALAKKMGTKQSAIARLESGTSNPTVGFLGKVAKALDARLVISMR
jgi:ribosome-binding protein aMBF1 (putative translation factor)